MRLIECARQAGVTADTLRHYLRVGLVVADGRTENGYRTFSELLEDARTKELLDLTRDEKSGGYVVVGFGPRA